MSSLPSPRTWRQFALTISWLTTLLSILLPWAISPTNLIAHIAYAILGVVVIFFVPGFVGALLIEKVSKQRWSLIEYINVALATSLFLPPFCLFLLHRSFGYISADWPLYFTVLLTSLALLVTGTPNVASVKSCWYQIKRRTNKISRIFLHPFLYAALVYLGIYLGIVLPYAALPDLDPYTWLNLYEKYFASTNLPAVPPRPLFYYLIYLLSAATQADIYTVFKYILPASTLVLLSGAALAATHFTSWLSKMLLYLAPVMTASTILYAFLSIPQTMVIWIAAWVFFWLVHSFNTKNNFWIYATGFILLAAFSYHEVAILFLIPWVAGVVPFKARQAMQYVSHNPLVAVLLLLLVASNLTAFASPIQFVQRWFYYIFQLRTIHPNLVFPTIYTNIDGVAVGWAGVSGVIQYYLYYIGPPLIFIVTAAIIALRRQVFRRYVFRIIRTNLAGTILLISFVFFVFLTEVSPRLASVNLLPERAWIFGSLVGPIWLILYLKALPGPHQRLKYAVLLLTLVSVAGALYINWQKKYLITDYQIAAAHWITKNLPTNRLIIGYGHTNLITRHANSPYSWVPPEFYCNPDPTLYLPVPSAPLDQNTWRAEAISIASNTNATSNDLASYISKYVAKEKSLLETQQVTTNNPPSTYVFFSPDHPKNPYRDRPYEQGKKQASCQLPTLTQDTAHFTEVYNDAGRVIIWQLHQ